MERTSNFKERVNGWRQSFSSLKARVEGAHLPSPPSSKERKPLTLSELFHSLRELTERGLQFQHLLMVIWSILILSLPLDIFIIPFLQTTHRAVSLPESLVLLALFVTGALSYALSFHRHLLLYGHHLDRGLNTFQKSAGEHPWFIVAIFAVAFLFELTVRLESLGLWPLIGILLIAMALFPILTRNWKAELQQLSHENERRIRIVRGAQIRNFYLLLFGMVLARVFSVIGAFYVTQEGVSTYLFPLFLLGSFLLLAAALPYERMFVDRCRRCGRTFALPLEPHHLCLICTRTAKSHRTEGKVSIHRS